MSFFPLLNINESAGFCTVHNFPPNNWENISKEPKNLWSIYSDGKKWITNLICKLNYGESKTIYYKDFNLPHNHGADLVSGVFYVKVPENSGNIVFQNSSEFLQFNNDNIKNFNEYNSTTWSFIPKNQELFLFPSWINHYVQPNLNKKEKRISIAFNINTK